VLEYANYADDVRAGFLRVPAALETCDITIPGNCSVSPVLTVGLTEALKHNINAVRLECPPYGLLEPVSIQGYNVCDPDIPQPQVTVSEPDLRADGTQSNSVLCDTGTPFMSMYPPSETTFPSHVVPGSTAPVNRSSDFTFTYVAGDGDIYFADVSLGDVAPNIVGLPSEGRM
jgi:hypothetical protein